VGVCRRRRYQRVFAGCKRHQERARSFLCNCSLAKK
jgi:hypothetical protein